MFDGGMVRMPVFRPDVIRIVPKSKSLRPSKNLIALKPAIDRLYTTSGDIAQNSCSSS